MSIIIQGGKIFIEGKETVDVNLIGYALLDFAEEYLQNSIFDVGLELCVNNKIEPTQPKQEPKPTQTPQNLFNVKDKVYLVHDIEQLPRLVTKIIIDDLGIMYELACATEISVHYNFELSKDKTVF
jgi:hypothetical protein